MEYKDTPEALRRLYEDPDIQGEVQPEGEVQPAAQVARVSDDATALRSTECFNGRHRANRDTANLAYAVGGIAKFREMTNTFYNKAFQDTQLDPSFRDRSDPHGERFATWIAEKMGLGSPWSDERRTRTTCPFQSKGHTFETARQIIVSLCSLAFAERSDEKWGRHFKLDDCRVWMRLHFWSAREVGMFNSCPEFMDYYVRFISILSVYMSEQRLNLLENRRDGVLRKRT